MTLSVIVPVYNVAAYLDECLERLQPLAQEKEVEVICVNDGSTDKSTDILRHWSGIWPGLHIINQPNRGLSGARNTGLKAAQGEYVAFIDSDDFIDHNLLLGILQTAKRNDADIAIGDYLEFADNAPQRNYELQHIDGAPDQAVTGPEFFRMHYKPLRSVVWRSIYKRSFIITNKLSFHEGVMFEDVEFTPIAFSKAGRIIYSQIPFYYYRKRGQSITTSQSSPKKVADSVAVWEALTNAARSNRSLAPIMRELGFHSFLSQFSLLMSDADTGTIKKARRLSRKGMYTIKYKLLAAGINMLPCGIFHKLLQSIR